MRHETSPQPLPPRLCVRVTAAPFATTTTYLTTFYYVITQSIRAYLWLRLHIMVSGDFIYILFQSRGNYLIFSKLILKVKIIQANESLGCSCEDWLVYAISGLHTHQQSSQPIWDFVLTTLAVRTQHALKIWPLKSLIAIAWGLMIISKPYITFETSPLCSGLWFKIAEPYTLSLASYWIDIRKIIF